MDCLAGGRVLLHEEVSDSPGESANGLPALFRLPAVDVDPAQDDADNDEQCRWPDLFVRPLHPCPNGVDRRRRNHRDRLGSGLADTDVERRHDGVNPLRPSANAERGEILGVVGKQDAWRQQRSQCRGRIVVRVQFLDSRSTLVEGAQPVRKRDDPDEGKPLVGKEPLQLDHWGAELLGETGQPRPSLIEGSPFHEEADLSILRPGDTLVIWRLDRLGRNLADLINIVTELGTRGVAVRSLTNGLVDTTTAHGKLVFGLFALLAEYEAALIKERTQAGLAAARARGRKGGRKPKMTPALIDKAQRMYIRKRRRLPPVAQEVGGEGRSPAAHLARHRLLPFCRLRTAGRPDPLFIHTGTHPVHTLFAPGAP